MQMVRTCAPFGGGCGDLSGSVVLNAQSAQCVSRFGPVAHGQPQNLAAVHHRSTANGHDEIGIMTERGLGGRHNIIHRRMGANSRKGAGMARPVRAAAAVVVREEVAVEPPAQ